MNSTTFQLTKTYASEKTSIYAQLKASTWHSKNLPER